MGNTKDSGAGEIALEAFTAYASILKKSQDKFERLFKLRRDITIESKRVIFLLHSIDKSSNREEKIKEAKNRLNVLKSDHYQKISVEIDNEDPYKYSRAICPGNEEFIEAYTFLSFLETDRPMGFEICAELPFATALDYVLGVADLTGELMRHCISSIGLGNNEIVGSITTLIRELYTGMLGLPVYKEVEDKMPVVKANVCKIERVRYNLHVMGTEVAGSGQLLACLDKPLGNTDEG